MFEKLSKELLSLFLDKVKALTPWSRALPQAYSFEENAVVMRFKIKFNKNSSLTMSCFVLRRKMTRVRVNFYKDRMFNLFLE